MRRLIAIALLLLLGAVTVPAQEKESQETKKTSKHHMGMTSSAENKDFEALRKEWRESFNAKDAAKLADLYTDDATLSTPAGTAQGKEQIRALLQKGIDAGQTMVAITPTKPTEAKGDFAYGYGTYQVKQGEKDINGEYLTVFKKVGGQWKIAAHAAVVPMPAPAAKETKE